MVDVSVGVGWIGRGLSRIRGVATLWWRGRDPARHVTTLSADASVRIDTATGGEASFRLNVVNFSSRDLIFDRFDLEHWSFLSYGLPSSPPVTMGLGATLPKRSVGTLHVKVQLHPPAIETIKAATSGHPGDLLCGHMALKVSGRIQFKGVRSPVQNSRTWWTRA